MTKREDGGPTFQVFDASQNIAVFGGMTMRDYFAGRALAGRAGTFTHPKDAARNAYAVADAMLEERAK